MTSSDNPAPPFWPTVALLTFFACAALFVWRIDLNLDRFYDPDGYQQRVARAREFAERLREIDARICAADLAAMRMKRGLEIERLEILGFSRDLAERSQQEDEDAAKLTCTLFDRDYSPQKARRKT